MNIWLINHYAVPPQYYPLIRQYNFGKYLIRMGHTVTIFAASTVHNSDINLITDDSLYKELDVDGIKYVVVKCKGYSGNGIKRVMNMLEFSRKLPGVCKHFKKPDAIVSTSMPPFSCAKGIKIAKKYGCKAIAEIADLWPESIVAYGIAGPHNPAVIALRRLEKWMYKKSDAIIFTMEGAYDYIKEQHWEKAIPRDKVFFINNGVDLEMFDYNKTHFTLEDSDLDDPGTFKVIYTGSFRKANEQIMKLMDVVKLAQGDKYKGIIFLLYGKGELAETIKKIIDENGYKNVIMKGCVEKKYIPYILSKCNLNILNLEGHAMLRYGGSQNKLFEYLASGHPIITGESGDYSVVSRENCGVARWFKSPEEILDAVLEMREHGPSEEHIRNVAKKYDFKILTEHLVEIIEK